MRSTFAVIICAAALFSGAATGAVSFDSNTGTGRVGQADIAPAFGWSAAQFQQYAGDVRFVYAGTDNYSGICSWMGPSGPGEQTESVTIGKTANINTTLDYDTRTHRMATGFILGGFAMTQQSGGPTPVSGGPCQGPLGVTGTWKQVMPLTHSGTLSAVHAGISVPLPF